MQNQDDPKRRALIDELYRRYRTVLKRFLARHGSAFDPEDLLHELFIKVLKHTNPEALSEPIAYLFKTAKSVVSDAAEKDKRSRQVISVVDPSDLEQIPTEDGHSSEEELAHAQDLETLRRALGELSPEQMRIFELYFIQYLTAQQVADQTGINFHTVKKHVLKVRAHLAKRIREAANQNSEGQQRIAK